MNKNNLQTGIWLIGIGILAFTNYWWPGIMFVIGVSALASGSLQATIWLFGIGVLAIFDFWWPGILFLIGGGILVGALFPDRKSEFAPDDPEDSEPISSSPAPDEFPPSAAPSTPSPFPTPSRAWLPTRCPACGAPLTPTEAIWHDATHAECSYCHTPLSPN
ncbi:MAG: hypothetical protein HUU38_09625 [Anaerolineales bacterium]|nr:hypothetical protein [Anaerolineales bacterium]